MTLTKPDLPVDIDRTGESNFAGRAGLRRQSVQGWLIERATHAAG